jgi:hypothetical protein
MVTDHVTTMVARRCSVRENIPLDTFTRSSLHCSPWESRPDVHESMHHATRVRVDPILTRAGRQAIIGGAIFVFPNFAVANATETPPPDPSVIPIT